MTNKKHKGPGKANRAGIPLLALMDMFPDENTATQWFEAQVWPDGRCCGHCGCVDTKTVPNAKPMPYWCPFCRSYFSVRTGTALERSRVPLRKWAIAIYLEITSLKSVSSIKLHRDLGVSQPTAWFMLHRIREGWKSSDGGSQFSGPVEVDETYFGGKRPNMSNSKREELTGRGPIGKTAVVGAKDRETNRVAARVVASTDKDTPQGFVKDDTAEGATVYTDDAGAHDSLPFDHEAVRHSVAKYVCGKAHTNGIESFWAVLKRSHNGVFPKISAKHLNLYITEFAGKRNFRDLDTLAQMAALAAGLAGKRLIRRDLVPENGLPSGARS